MQQDEDKKQEKDSILHSAKPAPRVLLLTSSSVNGLCQLSSSLQAELSSKPDALDSLCCRSLQDRLELSGQPGTLYWAVAGHDWNTILAELRKGPPPENLLRKIANYVSLDSRKLLFVFSGQGSELVGSWHELYKTNLTFAASMDRVCLTAKQAYGLPLASALGLEANLDGVSVMDTKFLQPAIFALQISLTNAWAACGIVPDGVVGHSFGEYAAAVAAGVMTWCEGLALVVKRASLMASLPQNGAMLVVFQSEAEAIRTVDQQELDLSVACVNAPTVIVMSGSRPAVDKAESTYTRLGVQFRRLHSRQAFHSKHMKPILDDFGVSVSEILSAKNSVEIQQQADLTPTFFSTVLGRSVDVIQIRTSKYWETHTEQRVEFVAALEDVQKDGRYSTVVEIGPGADLLPLVKRCLTGQSAPSIMVGSLRPPSSAPIVGTLFCQSVAAIVYSAWGIPNYEKWKILTSETAVLQHSSSKDDDLEVTSHLQLSIASVFRRATTDDIEELCHLEEYIRLPYRVGREGILRRIRLWSGGSYVLDLAGLLIAVVYAQRVRRGNEGRKYKNMDSFHDSSGDTIQLIHLVVHPDYRYCASDFHRNIIKEFQELSGISSIFAITHTVGYHSSYALGEYVNFKADRNLFFHLCRGGIFEGLVPDFCLEDVENKGFGIAVRYNLKEQDHTILQVPSDIPLLSDESVVATLRGLIFGCCQSIMGLENPRLDKGWLEMLDSIQLMQFHKMLEEELCIELPVIFFFKNYTADLTIHALAKMLSERNSSVVGRELSDGPDLASKSQPILIVGMACKLPGVNHDCEDIETLQAQIFSPQTTHRNYKIRSPLEFDHEAFGLSLAEARAMHSQQRWALEAGSNALKDAGLPSHGLVVGVYVGLWESIPHSEALSAFALSGMSNAITANRISYLFNLNGPSMCLDTACSSSLVAVDVACDAIRKGACDAALVIGVNVTLESTTRHLIEAGFLSKTGACHTLDERADGYQRSEGCVAIVLQRGASDTRGYAQVLSSAVNQDGKTANLHSPNPASQENLLRTAYNLGGVEPSDVSFIEMHGTGTKLGDPIEVESLQMILGASPWLTCAKAQFGHMEAASGLLGVIRAVLCIQNQCLPKNPFLQKLNPLLPPLKTPRESPVVLCNPIIAGVSSFGFGGTNSHVVLKSLIEPKHYTKPVTRRNGALIRVDEWASSSGSPLLDATVEMIRPKDVLELHSMVQARMDGQAPLCVIARDEELAAYVRTVRAECPGWAVQSIMTVEEPAGTPTGQEEGEWKLEGGIWSVRRLSNGIDSSVNLSKPPDFRQTNGVYVISGGLGYIGRLVAKALIEHGARKVVILSSSRSTLPDDWELEVRPDVVKCDIGELAEVQRVFDCYKDVRGVIHAAGVLSDGTLKNLRADDFERVYRPKVHGARNLDECSRGLPLDFFVLFSSVASGFGGAGQANYAAANGFLDSLAQRRVDEGEVGLSVRWGAWSGGGMAADKGTVERAARSGLLAVEPALGVETLLRLMSSHLTSAVVTVCPLLVSSLPDTLYFCQLSVRSVARTGSLENSGWPSDLRSLAGSDERRSAICAKIHSLLSLLGVQCTSGTMPWGQVGLDSLSMVELRNMLSKALGEAIPLSRTVLFDYPNLDALVYHIDTMLFPQVADDAVFFRAERVEPLAIVGMTCRFGGGINDVRSLWAFLEKRDDAIREIPLDRMNWATLYDPDVGSVGKIYTNRAAFIEKTTLFDNVRFGIPSAEAILMDPQQRLALETAYEALLHAGISIESKGRREIGVFVAESFHEFYELAQKDSPYSATGGAASITANRLAYIYGLSSLSMTIDTACSSGLVAIDAASKAIYNHDCDSAVVMAVNLILALDNFKALCAANMLSPVGRCATFSDEADGYARGEGCAAVVLKRLSRALEDGDGIWGVVHGTAVNQDGRTATMTAPNGPAQEEVIRTALQRAGVTPNEVGYVEAHGTGTPLGDPIEAGALARVFKGRPTPLVVGALKSNIGHTEAAAGLAGLIKAVLCLHYGRAPPNIHCERLNPLLAEALAECSLVFPQIDTKLDLLFAGVSSFGFGGTNAHVVVGVAPPHCRTPIQHLIEWNYTPFPWQTTGHPFLGLLERNNNDNYVWTCQWDSSIVEYLSNHRVSDIALVPGTCYMEMVCPAVEQLYGDVAFELKDVSFEQILFLNFAARPTVRVVLEKHVERAVSRQHSVKIESAEQDGVWTLHAKMTLVIGLQNTPLTVFDAQCAIRSCSKPIQCGEDFYATLANKYGEDFKSLQTVWRGADKSIGHLELQSGLSAPGYLRRCALLDCATHVLIQSMGLIERLTGIYATGVKSYYVTGVRREDGPAAWSVLESRSDSDGSNISLYDTGGRLLTRMEGMLSGKFGLRQVSLMTVDEWMKRDPPVCDESIEIIRPTDILELHAIVLARMDAGAPLCVTAVDEELASYVRAVRAECPGWNLQCIITKEIPPGVPIDMDEAEWRLAEGAWSGRRLRRAEELLIKEEQVSASFESEGTYVISGGLGYLGQLVAKALIERGAHKIVLLSSSRSALPEHWDLAIRPKVVLCDVGNIADVRRIFEIYKDVRGVVHAAGVLSDKTLKNLQADDFRRVYWPKVDGARNLDECTRDLKLDFFVFFSSVASGFGSAGQSNYAAANGFLDALAERRFREDLSGLSIRWGPWSGGGMANNWHPDARSNLLSLSPDLGTLCLLHLLTRTPIHSVVTVCCFAPDRLHSQSVGGILIPNTYFGIEQVGQLGDERWLEGLQSLASKEKRKNYIASKIVAFMASHGLYNTDSSTPWGESGLDSLSMVDLRNLLNKLLGKVMPLSSTVLFDYPNQDALVQFIDSKLSPQLGAQVAVYLAARVESLAIVGMACRFGGSVDSVGSLWEFLEGKGDSMQEIPLERMDWTKLYDPDPGTAGKIYTNRGSFIEGATLFDNTRFGISSAEAHEMAPHQRLTLETSYESLIQAGVSIDSEVRRRIGSFVAEMRISAQLSDESYRSPYAATGQAISITANRLAYMYGLSGPSVTIDTACSSALVALDAAAKAIYNNDCDAAVVVGVCLMLSAVEFVPLCSSKMLSANGRCASFSDEADGYARGEGCAAVVLKRLSRALEDGDGIWGVVHGTAVNQDGRTATMTAPNGPAQEEVIRTALQRAGVTPNEVGYVEAHGTGTPLGDPIEAGALARVFKGRPTPLVVGALKSNIGHTEAAAGLAGLIKAVLCLHYGRAPPNIHCERLNPLLAEALAECPLVFPRESTALDGRYAGVSSFGFGGTNAHAVIGAIPEGSKVPVQVDTTWHREGFSTCSVKSQQGFLQSSMLLASGSTAYSTHLDFHFNCTQAQISLESLNALISREDVQAVSHVTGCAININLFHLKNVSVLNGHILECNVTSQGSFVLKVGVNNGDFQVMAMGSLIYQHSITSKSTMKGISEHFDEQSESNLPSQNISLGNSNAKIFIIKDAAFAKFSCLSPIQNVLKNSLQSRLELFEIMFRVCGFAAGSDIVKEAMQIVGIELMQSFSNDNLQSGWIHAKYLGSERRCRIVDLVLFGQNGVEQLLIKGLRFLPESLIPPAVSMCSDLSQCASDVGILAFEYYCPNLCVRAEDIEKFHDKKSKYSIGRGQENITFCSDDEDAVSMAMSAFHRLMIRCNLDYDEIGRLEVGTECQVDRAKSIKSFLMEFFAKEGLHDVEGADTYNACYGGTNAFFNAVSWVQSSAWNGKYAVVICTDTAVHANPSELQGNGASAIAMLVGPRASFVLEQHRVSFMKHAWDFYRPIGWHNNDVIVDLDVATAQLEEALLWCQDQFSIKTQTRNLLSTYSFAALHCNAPYHAKRSFRIMSNFMFDRELSREEHDTLYKSFVEASTSISAQNVSSFCLIFYCCEIKDSFFIFRELRTLVLCMHASCL